MDTNVINLHGSKTLIKYTKLRLLKNVKQHRNKIISESISEISSFIHIYSQMHQGNHDIHRAYQAAVFVITLLRFFFPSSSLP